MRFCRLVFRQLYDIIKFVHIYSLHKKKIIRKWGIALLICTNLAYLEYYLRTTISEKKLFFLRGERLFQMYLHLSYSSSQLKFASSFRYLSRCIQNLETSNFPFDSCKHGFVPRTLSSSTSTHRKNFSLYFLSISIIHYFFNELFPALTWIDMLRWSTRGYTFSPSRKTRFAPERVNHSFKFLARGGGGEGRRSRPRRQSVKLPITVH